MGKSNSGGTRVNSDLSGLPEPTPQPAENVSPRTTPALPRLCFCGRQIVSLAGTLPYCTGCGQAFCSCVVQPAARPCAICDMHPFHKMSDLVAAPALVVEAIDDGVGWVLPVEEGGTWYVSRARQHPDSDGDAR